MRIKKWQSVVLCSLVLLLIVSLSAGLIGLSYAGAAIVPVRDISLREDTALRLEADFSAYGSGVELDPEDLYDLACRQTVYLYWMYIGPNGSWSSAYGTGIIVSQDGYILTNAHCVDDAITLGAGIMVELYDGRTFTAAVAGSDTESDVALLKIETSGLSAAVLSGAKLKNCQTVYVMGHPNSDLKFTMTRGIVSGQDRVIRFNDDLTLKMFQVDATVNSGNSGGPAYDVYGRVVGMVTAKYVTLSGDGNGLAIPIQDAVAIAGELKEFGYVRGKPLMGIVASTVTAGLIRPTSPAGVMVHTAEPGLPGNQAGLIKGDIILSVDGKEITSLEDLNRVKKEYRAGDTVRITFWRDEEILETELTFGEVTPEHPVGPVAVEEEPEADGNGEGNKEETAP